MSRVQPRTSLLSQWFPALAEASVRLYLTGQIVSVMGAWVVDITLNLVAWHIDASPATLGILNFLIYAPTAIVTPLFASLLTRSNARRVTLRVLGGTLAVGAGLTVLTGFGLLTLPVILVTAGIRGLLNGMEMPSRQMILFSAAASGEDPSRLANAVAMNTTVYQVARMLGPALAALLYGTIGPVWAFAASTGAFMFMWLCIARLPNVPESADAKAAAPGPSGMRAAIAYVRQDRFGALFLPITIAVALFVGAYQTLVPVLASRVYGSATTWTGAFFGAAGGGALVAAVILSSRFMPQVLRRLHVVMPWLIAVALCTIGLTRHASIALPAFFMIGFGSTMISTGTNAMLQQHVPASLRSGLIGLFLTSYNGVLPLSQLLGGALAERLTVQPTFIIMGAGLFVCLLGAFMPRWIGHGRLVLDAEKV